MWSTDGVKNAEETACSDSDMMRAAGDFKLWAL